MDVTRTRASAQRVPLQRKTSTTLSAAARRLLGDRNPRYDRVNNALFALSVVLVVLAAINVLFITWSTAIDARHQLTIARALGATPDQLGAGLSTAQLIPAIPGALLGIPAGIALITALNHGDTITVPAVWSLIAVVLGTLLAVAALSAIPARIGARRPVSEILQAEHA